MKSKGLTYVLLIVVAAIWYNVFFRIKDNLAGSDETFTETNSVAKMYKSHKREEFDINANYRDPFSGKKSKPVEVSNPVPVNPIPVYKEPKLPPPPKVHHWPKMKYFGTVKNSASKKPLCIINIDDMLFNLREGEAVLDGIVIKKIYRDSIIVQQGKNFKVVRK